MQTCLNEFLPVVIGFGSIWSLDRHNIPLILPIYMLPCRDQGII